MSGDNSHSLSQLTEQVAGLTDAIGELQSQLGEVKSLVRKLNDQQVVKDFYTTGEVAQLAGKADFTVREWCRLGRVHAEKRECGRGTSREWMIPHYELVRLGNEGLLPPYAKTDLSAC